MSTVPCQCAACGAPQFASPLNFTPRAPLALETALADLLDWCAGGDIPAELYHSGRDALAVAEVERTALRRFEERAAERAAFRRASDAAAARRADQLRALAIKATGRRDVVPSLEGDRA